MPMTAPTSKEFDMRVWTSDVYAEPTTCLKMTFVLDDCWCRISVSILLPLSRWGYSYETVLVAVGEIGKRTCKDCPR